MTHKERERQTAKKTQITNKNINGKETELQT